MNTISNLYIDGKRIYLRQIKLSDADRDYCRWMNDTKVNQFLESRFENWTVKKLQGYIRKVRRDQDYLFLAIIHKDSGRHIGNIKVGPIHSVHKVGEIGILIGEKRYWGQGFAQEAIRLVVNYCFHKLKFHKLTAGAYSNNIGSVKAFKKCGFSIEGIRKKHYFYKGRYVDSVLFGLVNPLRRNPRT